MDRKTKKFAFKSKKALGGLDLPVPPAPPAILEIELTDETDDDEDFFTSQPPASRRQQTSINHTSSPSTGTIRQNQGLAASTLPTLNGQGQGAKSPSFPSSTNAKPFNDSSVVSLEAKEGWRTLMTRMQTNQKTVQAGATTNGSANGRKRILKNQLPVRVGPSFSSKVLSSSNSSLNVRDSEVSKIPPQFPSMLKDPPPKGFFPIGSGFKTDKNTGTTTATSSLSPYVSSFNHDIEDYSNVIGWESEPEVIQLNEPLPSTAGGDKVSKRSCPFYKKIPGTRFAVDAFSYGMIPGIDVYLLSHFHSDHYMGLTKNFSKTLICDPGTGNLVHMKLGVSEKCIRRLQLNHVYSLQGVKMVLMTANHCPGSVMFILRLPDGTTVLHTGDFRFTSEMLLNPFLASLPTVDSLYLDTTYCDPKYNFPRQRDTITQVVSLVKEHLALNPQTLILCGAYCIGKERVFFSLAEAIGTKVFCIPDKLRMLGALENPKYNLYLTPSESAAQVHVVPMRNLHVQFLSEYLAHRKGLYKHLIAIKPSGWEFSSRGGQSQGFSTRSFNGGSVTVIGLPYSEHSSFSELEEFVRAIKPKRVQPTVGVGNEEKRNQIMGFISSWLRPAAATVNCTL